MFTEAFVATCSPDELLGQVIQILCPRYNIDAPHLLALRQLLSNAIVAPRKPPTLKRTRPDKRIGEIGSIYNTPHRSPYGPNGPPVSANQSFYFHHQDADFERLLPRVDRLRYVWMNEPASQSESDGEEIPDSHESLQSQLTSIETPSTERNGSPLSPTSFSLSLTEHSKRAAAKVPPQAEDLRPTANQELASGDESLSVSKYGSDIPHKDASADSQKSQHPSVPTTTIMSTERTVTSEHESTTLSSPLLPTVNIAIELPESQEMHSVPPPPHSAPPFYMPQCSNTQDTVNSTQPSEVFSPSDDFINYTPLTQEATRQDTSLQAEMSNSYPRTSVINTTAELPKPSPRPSPRACSSSPLVSVPPLGKRSRGQSEATDDAPSLKRSKSTEAL
ncbi:uncharacterized protein M421DRAFT_89154 [Didymella exigua CBS 183.55]|uniref:Uncharacterized protein n=1 Tax=Didymella exigua CBS 183.55 TaxID=1150837 RepID=A0A6A5RZ54_9PLEO|nr:uncharacterized protein M421DRAFT_89154 [Didymella exigua CBS 183.55]KAF1932809.1 hypothetical protein M421DRAFT_89154 [Didymella exigua CBS 183.55]